MDYKEFVSQIRFKWLKPHHVIPEKTYRVAELLRKCGLDLETANTTLPEDDRATKALLREICCVPRMSTFAVAAIINKAVSLMPAGSAFVNVGVWHGFTLLSGMIGNRDRRCVGIDNFSEFGGPKEAFLARFNHYRSDNHDFFEKDYRDYFATEHDGPIGFYIYDGEHSYHNQLEGLKAAEPFFRPGTVVLVDDTNWEEPYQASLDFIDQSDHHYEMLFDQKTRVKAHPTYWNGILIFRRS